MHANLHRFRHTVATWAIENHARELDVQYLLGQSTSALVRRYSATYDAAKAAAGRDPDTTTMSVLRADDHVLDEYERPSGRARWRRPLYSHAQGVERCVGP